MGEKKGVLPPPHHRTILVARAVGLPALWLWTLPSFHANVTAHDLLLSLLRTGWLPASEGRGLRQQADSSGSARCGRVAGDCAAAGRSRLTSGGVRSPPKSSPNHRSPEAARRRLTSRPRAPGEEHGAPADRVPGEPDHVRGSPLPHAGTAQAAEGEPSGIPIAGVDGCQPNPQFPSLTNPHPFP